MEHKHNDHETWLDSVASKDIRIENGEIRVVDEPKDQKQRHWLRNRVNFFILIGLLVTIIGWLMAGVFFSKISLGSTVISARQSDTSLRNIIEAQATAYRLKIVYPDESEKSFSLTQMGLQVDLSTTIASVRERQHSFSSRLQWWQPTTAYLHLISNDPERNSFIAKHTTVTIQPPKDATIFIKDGVVKMTDSIAGKHYGLLDPIGTVGSSVSVMQGAPISLQLLSKRPAISSKQLAPHQTKLKNMLQQDVMFVIGSKTYKATTADIAEWLEITLHENGRKIDITVNSGKVVTYLNKIAAPRINLPKPQVEFINEAGAATILSKGAEGTDIKGKSQLAANVATDLLNNKAIYEILKIEQVGFKNVSANAYDKWIEVDLTAKRMYAFERSTKVKTFLVSAGAPATPTVTGQYAIYSKIAQQDMRGLNVDGSSYFQPKVSWVNYFHKDYAIHGNYWRPLSWFGNINSSHGCVGLPDSEAEWIYSWAPAGTQIFIHT